MATYDSISTSLADINASVSITGDEDARQEALAQARALLTRLERPEEKLIRLVNTQSVLLATLQIAVDTNLLTALGTSPTAPPKSLSTLAAASSISPALAQRVLNILTAESVITLLPASSGEILYAPTPFSATLTHRLPAHYLTFHYALLGDVYHSVPAFLKHTAYANPGDIHAGAWQFAHGADARLWEWMAADPARKGVFQDMMAFLSARDILAATRGDTKNEMVVPETGTAANVAVAARLLSDAKTHVETPVFVDVGGGDGHDCLEVARAWTTLPRSLALPTGSAILLDTSTMIAHALATLPPTPHLSLSIAPTAHDFLTPLPAPFHGARLYHLGSILHDWPDATCVTILRHIAAAMTRDYSKLMLHEHVLDPSAPQGIKCVMDWWMMAIFSTGERSERGFGELVGRAGMRVCEVVSGGQGRDVVVCELV